jgi:ATP-dependent exoDNAse (exonuclease V) beta subunit
MMQWDELKNPYLHHFADFVHEYELSKGPDIRTFLDHYNLQKGKLAIQLPESDDAIRIMTIHKAKGLEFPVVILPFIDFSLAMKGTAKFLLNIDEKLVYTTLSAKSPLKEILDFQAMEKAQVRTDKMNQFYVAFTRPEERLYVCNYHGKSDLGSIAHVCFETLEGAKLESDTKVVVQVGQRLIKSETEEKKSQFFEPKTIKDNLWFPEIALREKDSNLTETGLSDEQRFGNQFHTVMAAINRLDQLEDTLQQFIKEGIVEANMATSIAEKIRLSFGHSPFVSLFENAIEIMNEQSIIVDETTIKRPDKVILKAEETIVIDYKTGSPNARDEQQMKEYLNLFQSMDFPTVKGYLFYISSNELKAI